MYAIFRWGGAQHQVAKGDVVDISFLRESKSGEQMDFKDVLLVSKEGSSKVGAPFVPGCLIRCEVVNPLVKGPKIISVKYQPNHTQSRRFGHRQKYTRIRVLDIVEQGV